jgi:hypothetical protein
MQENVLWIVTAAVGVGAVSVGIATWTKKHDQNSLNLSHSKVNSIYGERISNTKQIKEPNQKMASKERFSRHHA